MQFSEQDTGMFIDQRYAQWLQCLVFILSRDWKLCALRNIAMRDYQESVTTGQTDAGQSDPYVLLCFAGDTKTRHVFVKHGCPQRQQSQNMAKISQSNILTPPLPQGHGMSVKCEEPLAELTVQVWVTVSSTKL